jgi:hypothetical protein
LGAFSLSDLWLEAKGKWHASDEPEITGPHGNLAKPALNAVDQCTPGWLNLIQLLHRKKNVRLNAGNAASREHI